MKISVLMPMYNAGRFLDEAVRSILEQSYADFELLVLDDASTDGSRERIARLKDERIRLLANERNLGLAATLNRGLELASGELIARMDADDVSLPERFARQAAAFASRAELALCCTNVVSISEAGEVLTRPWYPLRTDVGWDLFFHSSIAHSSVMLRRSALGDLRYPATRAEDAGLWRALLGRGAFLLLPEVLLKYRVHAASMNQMSPVPAEAAALESARELMRRLVGAADADALAVLTRHYWLLPQAARPVGAPSLRALYDAGRSLALAYSRLTHQENAAGRFFREARRRILSYCFARGGRFGDRGAIRRTAAATLEWLRTLGPLSLMAAVAVDVRYRLRRLAARVLYAVKSDPARGSA